MDYLIPDIKMMRDNGHNWEYIARRLNWKGSIKDLINFYASRK